MRIVIDLQACQSESRFRGIGRYSMSLTKAIARQAGNHEIWIALSDRFPDTIQNIRLDLEGLVPKEHIVTFSIPGPVTEGEIRNMWRTRAAELLREYFLAILKPDIIHVSSLFEGWDQDVVSSIGAFDQNTITSVTLYDLIPMILPDFYLPSQHIKEFYFRKLQLLRKSNILLAISEYTRQEAIKLLGLSPDSITNIFAAADDCFKPIIVSDEQKNTILKRYHINKPFVLCAPGGFDERKNIQSLITAYSHLPTDLRKTHQLVITGKVTNEVSKIIFRHARTHGLGADELALLGYVPNEDLIALYNLCKLFVFPSFYEGFGLPVLEAMACSAAVIASNTTSIPEVIGQADALFDPTRPETITERMQQALRDEDYRQSLREHGLVQSRKFSWDQSARLAIQGYEKIYEQCENSASTKHFNNKNEALYKKLINSLADISDTSIPASNQDYLLVAHTISQNEIGADRFILS